MFSKALSKKGDVLSESRGCARPSAQEEESLRFGQMDGRMKLLLVLSGGLMLGGLMGASGSVLRRKGKKGASKGSADKRSGGSGRKSGRTAALLNR